MSAETEVPFYDSIKSYQELVKKRTSNSFKTPLIVSPMPDGRRWKLHRSFQYKYIQVPRHFVTDFASIPWVFWSFLPYWGKYGKAAVVHDYIYQHHAIMTTNYRVIIFSRKEADAIFLEGMLINGTKPWKAKIMHLAVRLFGWAAWKGRK